MSIQVIKGQSRESCSNTKKEGRRRGAAASWHLKNGGSQHCSTAVLDLWLTLGVAERLAAAAATGLISFTTKKRVLKKNKEAKTLVEREKKYFLYFFQTGHHWSGAEEEKKGHQGRN